MEESPNSRRKKLETLLRLAREGDEKARDQIYSAIYSDLRRLAAHYLRQERTGHTLQPTALVHEVFIRLSAGKGVEWQNRAQLLAVMARQMRWVLVDHARRRKALKRGDTRIALTLVTERPRPQPRYENILAINEALEELDRLAERTVQVVEMRVFSGMNAAEIGSVMGISATTVKREWTFAKTWLSNRLR